MWIERDLEQDSEYMANDPRNLFRRLFDAFQEAEWSPAKPPANEVGWLIERFETNTQESRRND